MRKPDWFRKQGAFAIAIFYDKADGWWWMLKIGKREASSVASFVRLRDAERAARVVWAMLFGEEWGA